jgi:anaerobic magnesium-protoporphyrin IX monomethyl ester cyclase
MKKIMFLNPPCHKNITSYPPVGILSMAACLKKENHQVVFVDIDVYRHSPLVISEIIRKENPDLIGISLNVSQVMHSYDYIDLLEKEYPEKPIVLGGPYVTGVTEKIYEDYPLIDFAVIGEGEEAIVGLADYLEGKKRKEDIPNLIYKDENRIICNQLKRIQNLDSLPLPDYSIIPDITKYSAPYPSISSPSVAIMCTRGCPFNCTFCSSPITWKRKLTLRSVDSIIKEIIYLKNQLNVKEIFFQDDTLNVRSDWFLKLCDRIIENNLHKNIYFKCSFKANEKILSEEILKRAKQANFWMIFYGVENGNQKMLEKMNKNITLKEIKRAFRLTRKYGLISYASFMVGNIGETEETVKDSIKLLKKIMPDYGGFAVAAPFPGSYLFQYAKENNLITINSFKNYQYGDVVLRTEKLSIDEIKKLVLLASNNFNKLKKTFKYRFLNRNNKLIKLINQEIVRKQNNYDHEKIEDYYLNKIHFNYQINTWITFKDNMYFGAGWSYEEEEFRWSDGKKAYSRFNLKEDLKINSDKLVLVLNLFRILNEQILNIIINNKFIANNLILKGEKELVVTFPSSYLKNKNLLVLEMLNAKKLQNESRLLGLALSSFGIFEKEIYEAEKEKLLKPLLSFNFGINKDEEKYLNSGWSVNEHTHRWSLGNKSVLVFYLSEKINQSLNTLNFILRYRYTIGKQNIQVKLNNHLIGYFVLEGKGLVNITINAKLFEENKLNNIEINIPDAKQPGSEDKRVLGIALEEWGIFE